MKSYLMLQYSKFTGITISELLKQNLQGEVG